MHFHIMTLFPDMVLQGLHTSIIGKAVERGHISIEAVNIRDYTEDKHNKVDDYTYGGGAGMLMQAQPVFDCFQAVSDGIQNTNKKLRVVYVTPQGETFTQEKASELAKEEDLVFLCGHYEGIDERVLEEIVTDYISIGDYVLTGGELPAMVMIDAISRLVPGVLNNDESATTESFHGDLLEYPQYSRPEVWEGKKVPEVLLSGNHAKICKWRVEESEKRTKERRPDLYVKYQHRQKCIKWLMKKKNFHMDMIEILRRCRGEILYFNQEGVLLRDDSGTYMMSVSTKECGSRILKMFETQNWEKPELFVSHQEYMNDEIANAFRLKLQVACKQAVYTTTQMLPWDKSMEIKRLPMEELDIVRQHYHELVDETYLRERIRTGNLIGVYEEGKLAGFAGMHAEGSMGMLEIFEPYRRKGYGQNLESYLINQGIERGETPFCQSVVGNEKSEQLQKKLGLTVSKELLYWYEK